MCNVKVCIYIGSLENVDCVITGAPFVGEVCG